MIFLLLSSVTLIVSFTTLMYFTAESLRRDGPLHIVEFSIDLKSHKDAVPASVGAFVYLTGRICNQNSQS